MSRSHSSRLNIHGTALVLVLSCLALLSILAVAFISSISTEVESAANYAASSDVKQVSQTAVNLVIAQIQEATSSATDAWASQPGLIKTYAPNGDPAKAFKLYSAANMRVLGAFNPRDQVDLPVDWKGRPSEFVDLNQPILVQDTSGPIERNGETFTANYPILDPGSIGTVKGIGINGNSTAPPDYSMIDPTVDNPAPMPVRWLYLLKDGSFRVLDGNGKLANANKNNPPVARMAFWTDDDSCKVNINTAAGDEWNDTTSAGTFMDTPRARTVFEEQTLAGNQPVNHEYQRFPGHPATTYLSAIFPSLTRQQIGDAIPRIKAGGSKGGTVVTSKTGITAPTLPFSDGMPLYASVDELRYVRSTTGRTVQEPLFSPRAIEEAKFFLTAQSRAPELNLFNRPRIALWPEPANTANRTAYDKTIAYCATVAAQPYYFVRQNANDPAADYDAQPRNQQLYSYLQNMTAMDIPGYGGNFLTKYPSPSASKPSERDQILTEIFDYIRGGINLLDTTSGAKTFAGTAVYDASTDMRMTPSGTGHVIPIQIGGTRGFGRSMTLYSAILVLAGLEAEVNPNGAVDTNGDGYLKGSAGYEKAHLAIIKTKKVQALFAMDTFSPSQGPVRFVPNLVFKVTGLDSLRLDGAPMGFPAATEINYNTYALNHEYGWGGYVNHAAFFFDRTIPGADKRKVVGGAPEKSYPLVSNVINIDKEYKKQSLRITGGQNVVVEIYTKDDSGNVSANYIQRIPISFDDVTVPVPTVRGIYRHDYTTSLDPTIPLGANILKFSDVLQASATNPVDSPGIVNNGYNTGTILGQTIYQVSRSLVPAHGDMRLLAATKDASASFFTKGRGYDSPSDNDYKTMWKVQQGEENSGGMVGAGPTSAIGGNHYSTSGKLVSQVTYDQHIGSSPVRVNDRGPAVTSNITGAYLVGNKGNPAPGDWDTGMGPVYDGAYINKADEGERNDGAYTTSGSRMSFASLFSPSRQVPSPVILGSLSTGVIRDKPWQTLLFCPNPAASSDHPGFTSPPDHLLLDLFWMPIVEPYAISEPFSTAGKINLNYQIVPFTNIERTTGLQAVLRSTRVTAIPTTDGLKYKSGVPVGTPTTDQYRLQVDIGETLKGFAERFNNNQPFRSATEICEMFLVPQGASFDNIKVWWDNYRLTGDNLRENPYSHIYSRLTTKSNTYTVHTRVQLLKKVPGTEVEKWDENKDKVLGEYRGSSTIERYLDPNLATYDPELPLTAYKFRTVGTTKFSP